MHLLTKSFVIGLERNRIKSPRQPRFGQLNSASRYYCSCGASYSLYRNLQQHIKYDCGKEPRFSCPYCEMLFRKKYNLHKHIRNIHKDVLDQ